MLMTQEKEVHKEDISRVESVSNTPLETTNVQERTKPPPMADPAKRHNLSSSGLCLDQFGDLVSTEPSESKNWLLSSSLMLLPYCLTG